MKQNVLFNILDVSVCQNVTVRVRNVTMFTAVNHLLLEVRFLLRFFLLIMCVQLNILLIMQQILVHKLMLLYFIIWTIKTWTLIFLKNKFFFLLFYFLRNSVFAALKYYYVLDVHVIGQMILKFKCRSCFLYLLLIHYFSLRNYVQTSYNRKFNWC